VTDEKREPPAKDAQLPEPTLQPEATRRDAGDKHEGPQRTSPYPMSRLAPAHDLVDVARQIAEADQMIGAVASAKLRVIAEQMRALQEQARKVLEETRGDLELHRARCSFARRPGQVYHLYRKRSGELWFSMIAPAEWGEEGSSEREFAGSYRLELDQSWTRVDQGPGAEAGRDGSRSADEPSPQELVRRLLGSG
jgi:hypothetical protein